MGLHLDGSCYPGCQQVVDAVVGRFTFSRRVLGETSPASVLHLRGASDQPNDLQPCWELPCLYSGTPLVLTSGTVMFPAGPLFIL